MSCPGPFTHTEVDRDPNRRPEIVSAPLSPALHIAQNHSPTKNCHRGVADRGPARDSGGLIPVRVLIAYSVARYAEVLNPNRHHGCLTTGGAGLTSEMQLVLRLAIHRFEVLNYTLHALCRCSTLCFSLKPFEADSCSFETHIEIF